MKIHWFSLYLGDLTLVGASRVLEASWRYLTDILECLGSVLERLGAVLERLGGVLEASWSRLGASWSVLERLGAS